MGAVLASFEALSHHLLEGTDENSRMPQSEQSMFRPIFEELIFRIEARIITV
jgi:hypothetical protein